MAHRIRLPCSSRCQLTEPLPIENDKDGKLTTQSVGAINAFMKAVITALNGNVSFGDGAQSERTGNIDGQTIIVKTPGVADTEFIVPHGLARIPIGRIVMGQDIAGQLYDSNRRNWGADQIFLKCNAASVTFFLAVV